MRKLPPQRMAFPESPDLFQFSLQFERGGGGASVPQCRFCVELVRIVFVLIRRASTKNATEIYFVDLNFDEKLSPPYTCSHATLTRPNYQKDAGEPSGRRSTALTTKTTSQLHLPGPEISRLQSSQSLCQLSCVKRARLSKEQNGEMAVVH